MKDQFDTVSYYHVAYRYHKIMNPLKMKRLRRLAKMCHLPPTPHVLDIGSGKGYASIIFAEHFQADCTLIDNSEQWNAKALELFASKKLSNRIHNFLIDALAFEMEKKKYDVILCLGTTAIYGGFEEAVRTLKHGLRKNGILVIGEPTLDVTSPKAYKNFLTDQGWVIHRSAELLDIIDTHKLELVSCHRSTTAEWDNYMSLQWAAIFERALHSPHDAEVQSFLQWSREEQEIYLRYQRHVMDWNVYLLRLR